MVEFADYDSRCYATLEPDWIALKPQSERHRGLPVPAAYTWRRPA